MLGLELSTKKKLNILCLGAHCDDIEIGCGGTLFKIFETYQVDSVMWVVFSSNEIRMKEAQLSSENFLSNIENKTIKIESYRDGFLQASFVKLKEYFEQIKSSYNPDLIFTHYKNDLHQDHRLVSELTWNTYRNHLILEYEIPKYDGDFATPNFYVSLDKDIVKRKIEIILNSFKSQALKHWFDEETFKALLKLRGLESLSKHAEAFYVRKVSFLNN